MGLRNFFGNVASGIKRNAPTILTTGGIALFLTSTICAIRATPKAMEAIEEKKAEEGHAHLTAVQTVQTVWRFYIPSLLTFLAGCGFEIASLGEGNKRIAALMATADAGRNLAQEFSEYRRFVAEKIGTQKEAEVYNNAAQEAVRRNPPPPEMQSDFVEGRAPMPMCYHASYGRYFYMDYETVSAAVNKLNNEINTGLNGYVSLNDFYDEIHVATTEYGDMVGWSTETGLITIPPKDQIRYAGTDKGWPCWILEFENPPQYEYQFFRKH